MTPRSTTATFLLALILAETGQAGSAKESAFVIPDRNPGDWEWSLSLAPSWRRMGQVEIHAGYRSREVLVPSFVGSGSLTTPPIGDESVPADRLYQNGYVRQDATTPIDGSTWYWGYDQAQQVAQDQLIYSASGARSVVREGYSVPALGPTSRDSLRGFTPHLQVDVKSPYHFAGFRLGFSGGFDFLQVDQSMTFSNYAGGQFREDYRLDYEDRYDLGGVIPPSAPYAGSLAGPGPIISNLPTSRSITPVLLTTDSANIFNRVASSVDVDAFSLAFGPSLSRSWGPLDFSFQAGVMFNLYNWKARQSETLTATQSAGSSTLAQWTESDSGTKFRPGLYLQGEVAHEISRDFSIGTYLRLDTAREFRVQAGPTSYLVDSSGMTTGLLIRYRLP